MIGKLSMYSDLFAMDAKYHQACYSHYISSRNLKYCKKSDVYSKANHDHLTETISDTSSSSNEEPDRVEEENDLIILHKAANIIRKALLNQNTSSTSSYASQESITIENCKSEVPIELLYLVSCVLNKDDYNSAKISETVNIPILATCNALMGNFKKIVPSSKNCLLSLCLGLQVYYTTKSKQNIELLYKMGYSCSYDEIRTFLTNFANTNLQRNSDLYIPESLNRKSLTANSFGLVLIILISTKKL